MDSTEALHLLPEKEALHLLPEKAEIKVKAWHASENYRFGR